jgi:hypothetical protein
MKKFALFLICLCALVVFRQEYQAQASVKQYTEIYSITVPLSIKVPAHTLIFRADSSFWMITDSTFLKTDSGCTILRKGPSYYHVTTIYHPKYTTGADSASIVLRDGAIRYTNTNEWIKRNRVWKKIPLQ